MSEIRPVRRSIRRLAFTSAAVCATGLSVLTAGLVAQPENLDVERTSVTAQESDSIAERESFVIEGGTVEASGSGSDVADTAVAAEAAASDEEATTEAGAPTVEELGLRSASTAVEAVMAGGELELPGDLRLAHPVNANRISSPYGMRSNPTGYGYQFHIGQDYPVPTGTPVQASGDGTVTFAGWHVTGGWRVEIDHGNGVTTAYSHNSQLHVSVGQAVSAGETLAAAGSTGNSTGPHVHLEIIVDGETVDPALYLPPLSRGTATDSSDSDVQTASTN
ncbi:M23 family metallopeptidase [Citricoccus sp. NR2]|uniref:M23 family metallopeptidase n=1 Tax=Citricoccus sp. NR2 TaxID=3004095 RepID=UPI0022DDB0CC|nr:M23 family metallopeptidase [Citricoccus sp. NR2]WBL20328.1 M23 family metallopeptidase [Citricoccus sp. NR2]